MNALRAVKGRLFEDKTLGEAKELIKLFVDAGCPVHVTLRDDGTYRLQTYSYKPRSTGKVVKK
jgi:hypothetical protein